MNTLLLLLFFQRHRDYGRMSDLGDNDTSSDFLPWIVLFIVLIAIVMKLTDWLGITDISGEKARVKKEKDEAKKNEQLKAEKEQQKEKERRQQEIAKQETKEKERWEQNLKEAREYEEFVFFIEEFISSSYSDTLTFNTEGEVLEFYSEPWMDSLEIIENCNKAVAFLDERLEIIEDRNKEEIAYTDNRNRHYVVFNIARILKEDLEGRSDESRPFTEPYNLFPF